MNEKLYKPAEVAEYLGVTVGRLAQMRYLGDGPRFVKLGRKSVRYRESDIQTWLDASVSART